MAERPLRVAWVVPGGVDRSGRERVIPVLLWLIERLARRHELHVIALHQEPDASRYPLLGATVHNLGAAPGRVAGRRLPGLGTWQHARQLHWVAHETGPWDVIHAFWAGKTGLLATLIGRWWHVPSVVSLAGGELVALPEIGYGSQRTRRGRAQVALTLRAADCLTVSTQYMAGLLAAHGHQARLVPLGVDPAHFAPPAPDDGPPFRLLHVASLNEVKDPWTLLRALRLIVAEEPRVHLDIVGGDTLGGAVRRECAALGLADHVTFHGFLPTEAVAPFFARAHLFLLPSRHDAAPVVVLEAAARAVPTVGTAVGYVADWAGSRALAVPVGDAPALAAAALALLRDPARRRALGLAAQRWCRAHDADWSAARFEQIYRHQTSDIRHQTSDIR